MPTPSPLQRALPLRPHHVLLALCLPLSACQPGLSRAEAKDTVDELKFASQSQALTAAGIELSTHFTLGGGAMRAAEELRAYIEAQLPCAQTELSLEEEQASLTLDYGANGESCTYLGQHLTGQHQITLSEQTDGELAVDHIWSELSNGRVELNGSASVTWDFDAETRHVVHTAVWKRLSDGHTAEGSGDRLQQAAPGGLEEGFAVEGTRSWKGPRGRWDLEIEGVEMRWADPIPQAGTYRLSTPADKQLSVSFTRASERDITVTVAGPRRSFDFTVHAGETD